MWVPNAKGVPHSSGVRKFLVRFRKLIIYILCLGYFSVETRTTATGYAKYIGTATSTTLYCSSTKGKEEIIKFLNFYLVVISVSIQYFMGMSDAL